MVERLDRPDAVTVVGVLHIVLGSLGLLCGACVDVPRLAGLRPALDARQAEMDQVREEINLRRVPFYRAYTMTHHLLNWVLSGLLLSSGLLLVRMNPAGRILGLVYSGLSLTVGTCALFYNVAFLGPAMDEFLARFPNRERAEMLGTVVHVLGYGLGCLTVAYPLITGVVLLMPSVGAAFRPAPPRPERRLGELDSDWYGPM